MATNSKIEWTDHTFNPWSGCTKVAEGCKFCYAEVNYSVKMRGVKWGPNGNRILAADGTWREPLKWNKQAAAEGVRKRVFCASLADVFEDWQGPILNHKGGVLLRSTDGYVIGDMDDDPAKRVTLSDIRRRLFALIDATPHLNWLLLTKRPENVRRMWPGSGIELPQINRLLNRNVAHRPNVWLGTSIATQSDADKNIPELLKCRDLSPVLFVSAEPLIGPVTLTHSGIIPACGDHPDLEGYMVGRDDGVSGLYPTRAEALKESGIDWVIIGGESGPHARLCDVAWIRSLKDQCQAAGVPVFVKQLGSRPTMGLSEYGVYVGPLKTVDPKGGDLSEWPEDLRLREFPEAAINV